MCCCLPQDGAETSPKLWYEHRGLELCLVAKEVRGKPSLRLVVATDADGRCGVGMNPSRLGVLGALPTEGLGALVGWGHSSSLCSVEWEEVWGG